MQVLIAYATVEGQTAKIARFVMQELRRLGHRVRRADIDAPSEISFEGVDRVILAAPVHQRRHPRTFEAFVVGQKRELERRKTLLMSVSLSAAFPEGLELAQDYLIELKMRTGFTPTAELLVPGAVRTSEYDYFATQVIKHVVLRDKSYDIGVGTHEFTDWRALSLEIEKFANQEEQSPASKV